MEVGAGDGDFLGNLCAYAGASGLAFSPAHFDRRIGERTHILAEKFGPRHLGMDVDLVCCRHVLQHESEPVDFLRDIRMALGRGPTPVYLEVPSGDYMLRQHTYWDVIYEHATYFTTPALVSACAAARFAIRDVYQGYEGQFLSAELCASEAEAGFGNEEQDLTELRREARSFGAGFNKTIANWGDRLARWRWESRSVAVWGAGSKVVSFLNAVDTAAGAISQVVDVNPRKRGMYVAGTGHRIGSPADLTQRPPDVVLVMNPVYQDEVRSTLACLGISAEVQVV